MMKMHLSSPGKRAFPLLALLLLCAGCGAPKEYEAGFFAMDTYMSIRTYDRNPEEAVTAAERAVFELEGQISRTRETAGVARLNAAGGAAVELPADTLAILRQAKELTVPGVFDVTICAVGDLWGINTEASRIPTQDEIDAALATVSSENLTFPADGQAQLLNGARLDLGAVGKGIAADRCVQALVQNGVENALVYLGGNIYALGGKPDGSAWSIGIADPDDPGSYVATLDVRDTSVVTTGDYERYFIQDGVRYHHVINPATGAPARSGLRSVTVVNGSSTLADARSTTLFVLGLEDGLRYCAENGLDAVFITESKQIYVTEGLRGCFTFRGEEAGYVLAP